MSINIDNKTFFATEEHGYPEYGTPIVAIFNNLIYIQFSIYVYVIFFYSFNLIFIFINIYLYLFNSIA